MDANSTIESLRARVFSLEQALERERQFLSQESAALERATTKIQRLEATIEKGEVQRRNLLQKLDGLETELRQTRKKIQTMTTRVPEERPQIAAEIRRRDLRIERLEDELRRRVGLGVCAQLQIEPREKQHPVEASLGSEIWPNESASWQKAAGEQLQQLQRDLKFLNEQAQSALGERDPNPNTDLVRALSIRITSMTDMLERRDLVPVSEYEYVLEELTRVRQNWQTAIATMEEWSNAAKSGELSGPLAEKVLVATTTEC